nr:EAL domain-containing protein [Rhodocyclus gracilis]
MLSVAVSAAIITVLVLGGALWRVRVDLDQVAERQAQTRQLVRQSSAMLVYAEEYALHAEDGPLQQWWESYHSVIDTLTGAATPDDQLKRELLISAQPLPEIVEQIVAAKSTAENDAQRRRVGSLMSDLISYNQLLIADIHRWSDNALEQQRRLESWFHFLVIALPVATLLILFALATLLVQRVLRPLTTLREAVQAVSRGDLSVRCSSNAQDEFGELSRTFDAMAVDLVGVLRQEIEERRQAELALANVNEDLANRESMIQQILDTSSVAIFLVDTQGRISFANRRMSEMFAMPLDRLIGEEYVALVHPTERSLGLQKMRDLASGKLMNIDLERRYVRADQSEFWGNLSGRRFYDLDANDAGLVGVIADVSVRRQAEQTLLESENRFREIFNSISDAIFIHDEATGVVIDCNKRSCEMYGFSREDIVGLHPDALSSGTPPFSTAEIAVWIERVKQEGPQVFEWLARKSDGHLFWVEVALRLAQIGSQVRLLSVIRDITARKASDADLRLASRVFTNSQEGIMITDADSRIVDVNPSFTRITGFTREDAVGQFASLLASGRQGPAFYSDMWDTLVRQDFWRGELWNRRKNGEIYPEMLSISAVRDDENRVQHYIGVFSDISVLKQHEEELDRIAHYDTLTGVPNRRLLADRLGQAIARAHRSERPVAVCYLDLDGFKPVNDTHGHGAGDRLLIEITARLKGLLRADDTLARLGGDEFVLLITDLPGSEECHAVLNRVLAAVSAPVAIDGAMISVSASIGVTLSPPDVDDADTLLRHADQAMYRAKEAGKNRFFVFNAEHDRKLQARWQQIQRLHQALECNEFLLHFQPKVDLITGEVLGAEALIRWQHPEEGMLAPGLFLPHLEGSDLEIDLGEWVIDSALRQMEIWHAEGLMISVSANVSANHLLQSNFTERLRLALERHPGAQPGKFELEILETAALSDMGQAARTLASCRELGVRFALDDFGTGYSSLTYFRDLPVDILKIDQSFVRDMLDDPNDLGIVEGVVRLAQAFNRQVIAEGVESMDHGALLLSIGCHICQGYGIARPMPAEALPEWIGHWREAKEWSALNHTSEDYLDPWLIVVAKSQRRWLDRLIDLLGNFDGQRSIELDPSKCPFGRWFAGRGALRYGEHADFHEIGRLHERIHALGRELLALARAGEREVALARVPELLRYQEHMLLLLSSL